MQHPLSLLRNILFLMLLLTGTVQAASPLPFTILPKESSLRFEVMRDGIPLTGTFARFSGDILFHPEALTTSKATVTVITASVKMDDEEAQKLLHGAEWLNITGFPNAVFTTTHFRYLEDNHYEANGTLTIKDMTLPIAIPFTLDQFSPQTAAITGEVVLRRKDFHIGWDDTASVADEVRIILMIKVESIF